MRRLAITVLAFTLVAQAPWFVGCRARAPLGAQCTFNGDCADPLVCAARLCRARCQSDRDCQQGELCVPGGPAGAAVCVRDVEPRPCRHDSDCELADPARTLRCASDGMCRAACRADYDCQLYDFRTMCMPDGMCTARPAVLDGGTDGGIDGAGGDGTGGDGAIDGPDAPADLGPAAAPVAVWPPATVAATTRSVLFRFVPGMGTDATRVEFCLDAACTMLAGVSLDVPVSAATGIVPMAPVGTVFWRVVGLRGGMTVTPPSSARMLTVPARVGGPSGTSGLRTDFNGDGRTDLLVGAPRSNGNVGRAYAVATSAGGRAGWTVTPLIPPTMTQDYGTFAQPAGDVNGDGVGDVVVAAPDSDRMAPRVWVYMGSRSGLVTATPIELLPAPPSMPMWTYFGGAIAAGDFNGDGFGDLAVGDSDAAMLDGAVHIYLGARAGIAAMPAVSLNAPTLGAAQEFGASLESPGDVDADGFDDLLVAWPGPMGGSSTVQFYRGTSDRAIVIPASTVMPSSSVPDNPVIAGVGDVNGDGFPDVAVGSPGAGGAAGEVVIYWGGAMLSGSRSVVLHDPVTTRTIRFGSSIAGLGDVDGDGFADFAVGCASLVRSGSVMIYRGGATLATMPVQILDELSATPSAYGAALGYGIDHDGDGRGDLYIGAPGAASGAGAILVFRRLASGTMPFDSSASDVFNLGAMDRGFGLAISARRGGG